jgi:histidinol dehydrogenase
MNVIPARIAGVGQIIMVVPAPDGELNPAVLAAASIAGVDRVFRVGGAQAIAALAFGTESIPQVDKIVGPGNRWVAAAKRQVFGIVGIDMIAGPSEVVVISDGSTDPEWVAADLLAQAEHDEDARAILICTRAAYLDDVQAAMERMLPRMPRAPIIRSALARNGAFILVGDLALAAAVANRFAPEHLGLSVAEPEALLGSIRHAGAIFVGCFASEVLGDYCAGPNHVLPTAGSARFSSPLGVYDFQKRSSIIAVSQNAASSLGRIAAVLAEGEGLTAHARSAELRFK